MAATKTLTCPECGREFGRPQSLGIHRRQKHGVEGSSPHARQRRAAQARKGETSAPAEIAVSDEFQDLAAPIVARANLIRAKLENVEAERDQLLADLRRMDAALRALSTVGTKPGPKGARNGDSPAYSRKRVATAEQAEVVEAYLREHAADFADGFTGTDLMRTMDANGGIPFGKERIRGCLDLLHDGGVIRLDRVVTGGGKVFKLVAGGDLDGAA